MFEEQYNQEMEQEVLRIEAKNRATAAGHPEWENACDECGCRLNTVIMTKCEACS